MPLSRDSGLRVVALFASSRRHGNTGQLMDRVANELQIEVIDLAAKSISAFDYQHRNRQDDFEPLIGHVLEFEQIIFASPVYWYSVSPPMKVFLDRISDLLDIPELLAQGRRLRGKGAYVLSTSNDGAPDSAFVSLWRETFNYLGMNYRGLLHADCTEGYDPARHEEAIAAFVRGVRNSAS
jgi:multimeric flavodoxin WrbA